MATYRVYRAQQPRRGPGQPGATARCGPDRGHAVRPRDPPLLLTHVPLLQVPAGCVNVHGHVHQKESLSRNRHINVSLEQLHYRPAKLSDIRRLTRRLLEGRTVPGHSTRARLNVVERIMPWGGHAGPSGVLSLRDRARDGCQEGSPPPVVVRSRSTSRGVLLTEPNTMKVPTSAGCQLRHQGADRKRFDRGAACKTLWGAGSILDSPVSILLSWTADCAFWGEKTAAASPEAWKDGHRRVCTGTGG